MFKLILKLFIVIILVIIGLISIVWFQNVDPAQQPPDIKPYTFVDTLAHRSYDLDSIMQIVGDHKGFPEGFEIAAAIAYSAYPQLKDVRIDMILTNFGPPMRADIDRWSLLGPRKNRKYQITLFDAKSSLDPILFRFLPFDAQVGILAHELGHVAYYHKLNAFQIAKWGWCYLRNDEFRVIHERTTDLMPVYHGLGSQIYQYAYYVRHDPSCSVISQGERNFMDKYYMTDEELWGMIRSHHR